MVTEYNPGFRAEISRSFDLSAPHSGPSSSGFHSAWSAHSVLRRIGALESGPGSYRGDKPSRDGVIFARAALLTWPVVRSRR